MKFLLAIFVVLTCRFATATAPMDGIVAEAQQAATDAIEAQRLPTRLQRAPSSAVSLALADIKTLPPELRPLRRYIWLPDATRDQYTAAVMALNLSVNYSSSRVVPPLVAGGALIAVDLPAYADGPIWRKYIVQVWSFQSETEPYFHGHVATNVKKKDATGKETDQSETINVSVGLELQELEKQMGNLTPDKVSVCPIVRYDWFVYSSLSSIDDGLYLKWRGIIPGLLTFNDYLKNHGVDLKKVEESNAIDAEFLMSQITKRPRGVWLLNNPSVKPSSGSPIIAITLDSASNQKRADQDASLSLDDFKPFAKEVFLVSSNGFPETTLWDQNDKLLAEAASSVATDYLVPQGHQARLQCGISCYRCHGPDDCYKPLKQEFKLSLGGRTRHLSELTGGAAINAQFDKFRKVEVRYSGDLTRPIKNAQDSFDAAAFAVTGKSGKEAMAIVSSTYSEYLYDEVTPAIAVKELGFAVDAGDVTGAKTFFKACPPLNTSGTTQDHSHFARLADDHIDPDTQKPVILNLTRQQWELIYIDAVTRSRAAMNKKP